MTELTQAFGQAMAAQEEAQRRTHELQVAYRALFYGAPSEEQRELVRDDLEAFCGMRQDLMRNSFEETANMVGRFRVWQRIQAFCFPRPADAHFPQGATHDRSDRRHQPTPGGGVADPTED